MKKIKVKGGLNIPLHGSVDNLSNLEEIRPKFNAVLSDDYFGLKPKILVKEGDVVDQASPLFEDKTNPGFNVRSPVAGKVHSINRGEKRALVSIIIEASPNDGSKSCEISSNISQTLEMSGLWDSFRERPFNRVPELNSAAENIFINCCKQDSLVLDPSVLIAEESNYFIEGLKRVRELAKTNCYVVSNQELNLTQAGCEFIIIEGNGQTGNTSAHIQALNPIRKSEKTWSIDWQDVIRIGKLFINQKLCSEKYISITGPNCSEPKIVLTTAGASMEEVTAGIANGLVRRISGSAIYGSHGDSYTDFLTRYSNQITLISDEPKATFFNWLKPGVKDHSNSNVFLSSILKPKAFNFDTNTNGGYRAIVPIGVFDEINPFDIDPTLFLKSLAIGDLVALRELGIFDLASEDMAVFSYVCPSKYDYVALFNSCMEEIWKEESS